jgi:hypothetical protein
MGAPVRGRGLLGIFAGADGPPEEEARRVEAAVEAIADAAREQHASHADDPNKGQFGGLAERDGRAVSATMKPLDGDQDYFLIRMTVRSTDPARPLHGTAIFHLHEPTFDDPTPEVPVRRGVASVTFTAWGAFTVGVEVDGGKTRLELDLEDVSGGSDRFYSR